MDMKKSLWLLAVFALAVQVSVAQSAESTAVSVSPSYSNLNPGDSLTVGIDISTTDSVYAFDITVLYDPGILSAVQVTEGGFLKSGGAGTFVGTKYIDNNIGSARFAVTRFGVQTGVSGTGTLFTIDFDALGTGTSRIGMGNIQLLDNNLVVLAYDAENGSAKVNTPPTVQAVAVSPNPAYTYDTLDCGFLVTDPDVLDTVKVNVTWIKNGNPWTQDDENGIVVASWGNTSAQGDIEPGDTQKGDAWVCRARAYDGLSEVTQDSPPVTIQNSLPSQPGVDVTPNTPYTNDNLVCSITTPSMDADGDSMAYSYKWYKDGVLQPGLTGNTAPAAETAKGETWKCRATPNDGEGDGPYGEDQATVLNSPPTAPAVDVIPDSPVTSDNLVCNIVAPSTDADGDGIAYGYDWYRGGVLQPGLTTNIVGSANTAKGQTWKCEVTPNDGAINGPKGSDQVMVQNSPPELSPIGDRVVLETQTLQFIVSATDNDTDALVHGTNASFGSFSTSTGEFTWITGWYDAGVYTVIFNVTDGGVVVEEVITITVNNNNRVPSIDSYSPLSLFLSTRTGRVLSFTHSSSDQDLDDTLAYSWRVNGTERAATQDWAFNPGLSDCGDREVRIIVSDSHTEASQAWTVNVKLSGDVDLDGDVDIFDLAAVGLAYGSQPGDANWNAKADLHTLMTEGGPEGNGAIDIFDLATVGLNYGKVC